MAWGGAVGGGVFLGTGFGLTGVGLGLETGFGRNYWSNFGRGGRSGWEGLGGDFGVTLTGGVGGGAGIWTG